MVTSETFPSLLISRALRIASVSDESGVMFISAACMPMVQNKLTKMSMCFIYFKDALMGKLSPVRFKPYAPQNV